jgi:hypothetical protein
VPVPNPDTQIAGYGFSLAENFSGLLFRVTFLTGSTSFLARDAVSFFIRFLSSNCDQLSDCLVLTRFSKIDQCLILRRQAGDFLGEK